MNENEEQEYKRLYIPFDIYVKPQLFDGFGREQYPRFFVGMGITLGVTLILSFLVHILIGLFALILGFFITVSVVVKQRGTNLSIVDHIILMIRMKSEQQAFRYVYSDEFTELLVMNDTNR